MGEDRGQDVWGGKGVRGDKVGGRREGQLCRKLLEPTRARTQTSWARGIQTSWAGGTGHADLMGTDQAAHFTLTPTDSTFLIPKELLLIVSSPAGVGSSV